MRRATLLMVTVMLLLFLSGTAQSALWHVHPDSALNTIQVGIDSSSSGDTVLVYPATYVENINFNGKNIVLGSLFLTTGDTSYIPSTIIDGNNAGSTVKFESGEDNTAVISGFVVRKGRSTCGGGIDCHASDPVIANCRITENTATHGGGIHSYASNPRLTNLVIRGNTAEGEELLDGLGGGMCCHYSSASLTNVAIIGNVAWGPCWSSGAGVYCYHSFLNFTNVTISGNAGRPFGSGCGIFCEGNSRVGLTNCILWNDVPHEVQFGDMYEPNVIAISYSCIEGDSAGIVTNNNGTVCWLDGNMDTDPSFADTVVGDFWLRESSPCIDAGTPDTTGLNLPPWDMIGNVRIWDGDGNGSAIIDMGAYEYGAPAVGINHEVIVEPATHILLGNYPNPFSSHTAIRYGLREDSKVSLKVYGLLGQEIRELVDAFQKGGLHTVVWDGRDDSGKEVPSSLYFVRLKTGRHTATRKLLLVR